MRLRQGHEARPEDITREIPNVSEDALKDLNSEGIIRIGAEVRAGDILVGKVTPKERRSLPLKKDFFVQFSEKKQGSQDTSLRVPHGNRVLLLT